jgi:hypothetical protein
MGNGDSPAIGEAQGRFMTLLHRCIDIPSTRDSPRVRLLYVLAPSVHCGGQFSTLPMFICHRDGLQANRSSSSTATGSSANAFLVIFMRL